MQAVAATQVPATHPGMLAIDEMFNDEGSKLEQASRELSTVREALWASRADIGLIQKLDGILSTMSDLDYQLTSAVYLLNGQDEVKTCECPWD